MPRSAALLALAVLATSCAAAPATTTADDRAAVTVTSCGQELTFARRPERVVTLDQSATETLLALGAKDRMAGTANLKTKIAPQYQAAYATVPVLNPKILTGEQLRAATPDLVVASFATLFTKDRAGTRAELAALGVPTFVSAVDCPAATPDLTPFDRLRQDYDNLGRILGANVSSVVAEHEAALAQAKTAKAVDTPSIVWLYSAFEGVPYVAGNGGMPSDMSRLIGARNAFDDIDEEWPEVSWEEIARRDPDVIVIGDLSERGRPGDSAAEKLAMLREHPVVAKLPAVRDKRIIEVPGVEMDPSVRTVHTLALLVDGMRELGHVR